MLWALPLVPAVIGLVIAAGRWRPSSTGWMAVAVTAMVVPAAAIAAATGTRASFSWGPRLTLSLAATGLSSVMVVLVPVIATAVLAWTAATHGGHDPRAARLVGMLLAFVGAMELLVLAADLLTLIVAWELVAVCSWVLIGHRFDDARSVESAQQAYLTTRIGDLGLFVAAGGAWAATGSFSFDTLEGAGGGWASAMAAGILVAAAAKSAQFPFSPWLFSAMAGPTPVSALLHSATMVAAGAYVLARLSPSFVEVWWFGDTVAGIGALTAILAGVVAAASIDLKRALAASTSAQYGLILVAIGAGSTAAAGSHLVTHAVFKALLFLCAGVIVSLTGTLDLRRLRVGRPRLVVILFGVGAAAVAAVPPLGGAWSKEQVLAAAAHASPILAGGVVLAAFLSALYASRLMLLIFGDAPERPTPRVASRQELRPLIALATLTVLFGGAWFPEGASLVERVTRSTVVGGAAWELPVSLAAIVVAALAARALDATDRLATYPVWAEGQRFAASWFGFPAAAGALIVEPTLALSRGLARFDAGFVDAGVRATAAVAAGASRLLAGVTELRMDAVVGAVAGTATGAAKAIRQGVDVVIDRAVEGVAAGSVVVAAASRWADDAGVDRAVERTAEATGALAARARSIQTGLSHHYYLLIAGGTAVLVAVAALGRA